MGGRDNGEGGRCMCRRRGGRGGGVRKDGESPRRRRSVMVAETAGSHLAKGQTGSEEEAAGRHCGARAHNSILQMTSAGSPAASPTSRLTPSAANTSRDEVDETTRVAVMSASRRGDRGGGETRTRVVPPAAGRGRWLSPFVFRFPATRNY